MKFIWYQTLPCDPPFEPIEIYLYIWFFLDFSHKVLGKLYMTGKNDFDILVQLEKKLSENLTHFPGTWKKFKKLRPVLYTPLYLIINLFWRFFFSKECILSLKLYIGVKNNLWWLLDICKTMTLLVNFSMNTTYKLLILIFLDLCQKISENLNVMGKNGFHVRIQNEKI